MIGRDAGQRSVSHVTPQPLSGFFRPKRRRAFKERPFFQQVVFGEDQIMAASLGGDPHALFLGLGDHLRHVGVAHVADVNPHAGLL